MSTTLSVIVPAYNAERYLADAVYSVYNAVARAGRVIECEIVVVDDGSQDGTATLAGTLGARLVSQANAGVAAARNRGVRESSGELVAFLDADDLWTEDRLSLQLAVLDAEPDALVLGLVEEFVSPDVAPERAATLRIKPGHQPGLLAGAMLCRRATFDRVGPFDTSFRMGELIEWFQRVRALGIVERMPQALVLRRRLHGDNMTLGADARKDYVALARALIARKRGAP